MIKIAMYQPDIPQNVGAMMRLAACMGSPLEIIEPCGFPWDERKIQQSGMDYLQYVDLTRHESWEKFINNIEPHRLVLMTTAAEAPYLDFEFMENDILLAGSESSGVPAAVHEAAVARVGIRMQPGMRSLNVVNATAMILGEALRQIN